MNEKHIPVLIVGGGLVGLSAALFFKSSSSSLPAYRTSFKHIDPSSFSWNKHSCNGDNAATWFRRGNKKSRGFHEE